MHWHGNVNHALKLTQAGFLPFNPHYLNFIRFASSSADYSNPSVNPSSSTVEFPFPKHLRPSPYEIFHLKPGASPTSIKSRYYQLVRIHHPDAPYARTLPSDVSHARFQAIQAAYDVLTGKMRRRDFPSPMYDVGPRSASSAHKANRTYEHVHRRSHFTHAEWAHSTFEQGFDSKEEDNSRGVVLILIAAVGLLGLPFFTTSAMSDRRHKTAAQNLSQARREAKEVGLSRRAEIRRRVRGQELDQEYAERVGRQETLHSISNQ